VPDEHLLSVLGLGETCNVAWQQAALLDLAREARLLAETAASLADRCALLEMALRYTALAAGLDIH
jgi:hypothetical protein